MIDPYYQQGDIAIYHSRIEEMPQMQMADLAFMDPPYGLGKSWKRGFHGSNGTTRLWGATPTWDHAPLGREVIEGCLSRARGSIIWGGNFYPLPPSRCWFVWDKLQSDRGADCELAWTNLDLAPKVFRMSRIDAYYNKARFKKEHGAEKPVQLAAFCIAKTKATSLLDPFCGSGNSLVAAMEAGIPAIGIDSDEAWCECAAKRIAATSAAAEEGKAPS